MLSMDMRVRTETGDETVIGESDWENLVHLLDYAGVDLSKLVEERKLDSSEAKRAGELLGKLKLECVETSLGVRIRGVRSQDTDPVLAITARLAEGAGDTKSAREARRVLLREMATLVVRPLNTNEQAKIEKWAKMLTESGGVQLID
jgi:hypothetical protein